MLMMFIQLQIAPKDGALEHISSARVWVKPKTIKLIFVATPPSMQH